MLLRAATEDDVSTLVELGRQSFTDSFGHLYAAEDLAAFLDEYRSAERFAASVASPDTHLAVAEEKDALLGYCTTYFGARFDQRPEPQPDRPCMLGQLYCAQSAIGRGVGTALLENAISEARSRGCDAMQLSVYSENFGAQRLYQRRGFVKIADIDFWVGNHRDDEFLYELRL
jgi:ribosomal protein S18 acetylase RimI-like enzyme